MKIIPDEISEAAPKPVLYKRGVRRTFYEPY